MLKPRNLFLIIGVVLASSALFVQSNLMSSENDLVEESRRGRVLGVSEEIEEEPQKNYLAIEELDNIIPIIDKSLYAPVKKDGSIDPKSMSWGSILVFDVDSEESLYERDAEKVRPIASISKLMTALVLFDLNIDWQSNYVIKSSDIVEGGRIYVQVGDEVNLRDLLHISLIASANTATKALVSASGLEYDEFVAKMNQKALDMGLTNTSFVDPIGLSSLNIATAKEVAVLLKTAMINPVIQECVQTERYIFTTVKGINKTVNNTDILLDDFKDQSIKILGGKTGFTGSAGYCFTSMFSGGQKNKKIITVILGSQTHSSRFTDTEKLANWAYSNYEWPF